MATPQPHIGPVGPDTLITVKVLIDGTNRRFKLALRDLGAHTLPQKLRFLLAVPPECDIKFDRFSDSAGAYITLDSTNPAVYKQLYRAAKAKLKLRLRAVVVRPMRADNPLVREIEQNGTAVEQHRVASSQTAPVVEQVEHADETPRQSSYLRTVLSSIPNVPAELSLPVAPVVDIPCTYPINCEIPKAPSRAEQLSRATLPSMNDFAYVAFSIDCNSCDKSVPNEHYHCSICELGDFDLCQDCVDNGETCYGDDHWLIKRSIKNGNVYTSVTETLPPKTASKPNLVPEQRSTLHVPHEDDRTCNGCVTQLSASNFVTCKDCPDFDLCFVCFEQGEHGHHPAHSFQPVDNSVAGSAIKQLCSPGRGTEHDAICDGCDKQIRGVRHKCLSCPDFDFCSVCIKSASNIHSGHRFAPLYSQLAPIYNNRKAIHKGIFCDGLICASRPRKEWIRGDRYKCAICHDTDFCANCEASPCFDHNKTHPLIKLKTPIRCVSVSTFDEKDGVQSPVQLGDRRLARNASTETTSPTSANAATQVQTIAEVKPIESPSQEDKPLEIKLEEKTKAVISKVESSPTAGLQAWFMSDSTPDGSTMPPNHLVSQSWTLRNPGPRSWPEGCAVYFTGGDDMRNLDMNHPSSVNDMTIANRSNILEEALEPGKTAVFTVLLKTPIRECRAISYWRLKTPDGQAFGHKLWVDISVQKAITSPAVVSSVPVPEPFQLDDPIEEMSQESSTMIFPKLEKESPESSVHDVAQTSSVITATQTEIVAPPEAEADDLVEDLESLHFEDDEATDDGFLTDEEYDILDADDEDFLEAEQKAVSAKR